MQKVEMNLVQFAILRKIKKTSAWHYKQSKSSQKSKKKVAVSPTFRLLHGKTIDDGKEKPQIIKFYDFTKGETDIVD